MLGLRFCARAFSSCGKRGPLFIAVCGPLTIAASLVAEHRLQTHRLSNCGTRAQLLCSMWDPPRPGLEPVSPALAGRLSTTAPPGKPSGTFLKNKFNSGSVRMGEEGVTNTHRTRCLGLVQRAAVSSFRPKTVVLPGRPASGWPRRDFPTCSTEGPPTPPTRTAGHV